MKRIMTCAILMAMTASTMLGQSENKERFMIKAHADFALGSAFSTQSVSELISSSGKHANDVGVDFGYTFFRRGKLGLSVNSGLSVTLSRQKLSADATSYDYETDSNADQDGNSYIRHVETDGMTEKDKSIHLTLPVFLDADWRVLNRLSVFAQAGVRLGFNVKSKTTMSQTSCNSYGVYPEYGDLVIDDDFINDFGEKEITGDMTGKSPQRIFTPQLMVGTGVRVNIWKPLWAELNLGYRYGGNILKGGSKEFDNGSVTEDNALVKYTVEGGTTVENLSSSISKSRVSQFILSIGVIYKF